MNAADQVRSLERIETLLTQARVLAGRLPANYPILVRLNHANEFVLAFRTSLQEGLPETADEACFGRNAPLASEFATEVL